MKCKNNTCNKTILLRIRHAGYCIQCFHRLRLTKLNILT